MLRPLRTLISLALVAGLLWFSFAVELGELTLAEHIDTISETPEAKRLVEDTRGTINPALEEARDRVLGEYVEAPTWIPEQASGAAPPPEHAVADRGHDRRETPRDAEPSLPGRR